jgi:L-ascorbate metabolism protein UlaG (beta-lactamase superfamily)
MRALIGLFSLLLAAPAAGQDRIPSHCIAMSRVAPGPEQIVPVQFRDPVALDQVRITYVDHAMFLIQTPGIAAVTDFTGFIGNVDFLPDVVTMNNAHATHWTAAPDPAIPHVLQGWAVDGVAAMHNLDLGEMLVRNVPTDLLGRSGGVRADGNSIFVFEAAGLCIGHLGHLNQALTGEEYAALGRMDVVLVPVDGGLTMDIPTVLEVMEQLRARIVIPMHWRGRGALDAFLAGMEDGFAIERTGANALVLSLADLPDRPTVIVLEPAFLTE